LNNTDFPNDQGINFERNAHVQTFNAAMYACEVLFTVTRVGITVVFVNTMATILAWII
jgi:hypothetical protein